MGTSVHLRPTTRGRSEPEFDFDVNKMFVNTIWKTFNVNGTRRICVNFRRSREYKDRENKLRILGRITEGSVPHVRSLTKYNITRNDINDLRPVSYTHLTLPTIYSV